MLVNHAIYNKIEMDKLVPNATYITIIRNPVDQLESLFAYFKMQRLVGNSSESNPFRTFMANPMAYYHESKNGRWFQTRNGMLFDLGFDHKYDTDQVKIHQKVAEIEKDFHLILIVEYFDESLIVLKKLLCWEFDDIFYLRKNTRDGVSERGKRFKIDDDTKKKVYKWSAGDFHLYDILNRTFWKKVSNYGPHFESDLNHFRVMNEAVSEYCRHQLGTGETVGLPVKLQGRSIDCLDLNRTDIPYTELIRESMNKRFGGC